MSLFEVGRICVKIAGRDAGRKCTVVEQLDNTYVLIDGNTRRKKVNIKHLDPLGQIIPLKKGASHEDVKKEFENIGLKAWETKARQPVPRMKHKKKEKSKEDQTGKKEAKAKKK